VAALMSGPQTPFLGSTPSKEIDCRLLWVALAIILAYAVSQLFDGLLLQVATGSGQVRFKLKDSMRIKQNLWSPGPICCEQRYKHAAGASGTICVGCCTAGAAVWPADITSAGSNRIG